MPRVEFPYRFIEGLPSKAQYQIWRNFQYLTRTMSGTEGSTIVVAASDTRDKTRADFICSGQNDQDRINEAIAALPIRGGRILLLEGSYQLTGSIVYNNGSGDFTLEGQGTSTRLLGDGGVTRVRIDSHNTVILRNFVVNCDSTSTSSGIGIKITAAPNIPGYNLIDNIVTDPPGDSSSYGIVIGVAGTTQAHEIVGLITNCELRIDGGVGASPADGIAIYGQPWHVIGNYVRGFQESLRLRDVDSIVVVGNHFVAEASGSVQTHPLWLNGGVKNSIFVGNIFRHLNEGHAILFDGAASTNNFFVGNRLRCSGFPTVAKTAVRWSTSGHSGNVFIGTYITGGDSSSVTGLNPIPANGSGSVAYHTYSTIAGDVIDGNHGTSGVAGGDLSGTYPSPTVVKIQTRAVSSAAPATNDVLAWNGTQWAPTAPSGSPTGPAGGDLSGNYPNPTVVKIQTRAVSSAAPATDDVLTWNGTQWAPAAPSGGPPSGAAGGDLSGNYPNPTVAKIQTRAVSSAAPSTGQALVWSGSQWAPAPVATYDDIITQIFLLGE